MLIERLQKGQKHTETAKHYLYVLAIIAMTYNIIYHLNLIE